MDEEGIGIGIEFLRGAARDIGSMGGDNTGAGLLFSVLRDLTLFWSSDCDACGERGLS